MKLRKISTLVLSAAIAISTLATPMCTLAAEDEAVVVGQEVSTASAIKIKTPAIYSDNTYQMALGCTVKLQVELKGGAYFASSNKSIVKIDKYGNMKALKTGKANITIRSKADKKVTRVIAVTVMPKTKSITVSNVNVAEGATVALGAKSTPSTASQRYDYKIENTAIATISNSKVKGLKAGTTTLTITARDGSKVSKKVTITVTKVVAPTEQIRVAARETAQINVSTIPTTAAKAGFTFKSENTAIATVSSTGVVTGVKNGTTRIAIYSKNGSKAKAYVSVKVGFGGSTLLTFAKDADTDNVKLSTSLKWENGATLVKDLETIGKSYPEMLKSTVNFSLNGSAYSASFTSAKKVKVLKFEDGNWVNVTDKVKTSKNGEIKDVSFTLADSTLGDYVSALIDITKFSGKTFGSSIVVGDTEFKVTKAQGRFLYCDVDGKTYVFYAIGDRVYVSGNKTTDKVIKKLVDKKILTAKYVADPK